MSWPQRAGGAPAPASTPAHPQRPLQGYNNPQSAYPNYQGAAPPTSNAQQPYWQGQPPQYNQQYGQTYQQPDYANNANQFYQQPQYNQNYTTPQYSNTQQQQYQQNYYQNQGVPQQGYPTQPNADNWEDNWDWGWGEDPSKQGQQAPIQSQATAPPTQQPQQEQVYNNANVIEESFGSNDTWNWHTEDKKDVTDSAPAAAQPPKPHVDNAVDSKPNEINPPRSTSNLSSHATEEVKSLNDRDVVKERLPNLALGKRMHLENLTPQWSIESQMSQESSDGPHTHSEGTYRSDNQSRNSSKSSPGINTENSHFNFSQSATEEYTPSTEWSQQSNEASTLVDNMEGGSRRESHDDLANSLQEMSIANRENPAPEPSSSKESVKAAPPSVSPANLPPPTSAFMAGGTPSAQTMPPAPPISSGAGLPPPSSSLNILPPPPTSFPQTSSSTNPFKQGGPFSHKKVASATASLQSLPPASTALTSPNVVNKVSQHRMPVGFSANLETTPDNSERPDQPQMSAFRLSPAPQQVPDNLEIAPQNDRNEYLQTAHLSSSDYGENTDFSRSAPPPGLRRMVVGQQESEYNQGLSMGGSGDEPPPGLARMVPGQQTEAHHSYTQPADNYLDRHIDGQPTEGARPYRQAEGQPTPENYTQAPTRGSGRPIGMDRMVPGESSDGGFNPQYSSGNYSANEQRVVTGVDHDFPIPTDAGPPDIREQNVDGSDYSEPTPRSTQRNVIGARDISNDIPQLPQDDQQREVTMEGENLEDISAITVADVSFSREQTLDGADVTVTDIVDRKTDHTDSTDHATSNSRRQSLNRVNTSGEESDRDRAFKASPRRDRDKHKSTRDRDRDREKEGRYSRGDRKYDREREERRSVRDKDRERDRDYERERREHDESPHSRRHRRSTRSRRYETEDTDYYSDRERERRSYREGSYASKPPRPDDKERRYDRDRPDRDRSRRYNTIERDRRPRHRDDRHDTRYRDIDPTRKLGNLRAERDQEERRRGDLYSSASRPDSRENTATDEELNGTQGSERRRDRRSRHTHTRPERDPYYDNYAAGYADPYELQRQQYAYYEQLRLTDPHAYLKVYQQLMAGRPLPPPPHLTAAAADPRAKVYGMGMGYEARPEDRGSVHSGRSSTNGLKGNDTYYMSALGGRHGLGQAHDASSLRDAPSLRTDMSDRELNTDASLNLHLEESTVRSERMTPFKFSTAHVKGNISSRNIVVVRPSYPVDGLPATVHIMSLAAAVSRDPMAQELATYPGPLVKGVTHKKSVMEYCWSRVRNANRVAPRDTVGYVLVWELLALMLKQNGVVVGTDIAELLMKNTKDYEYKVASKNSTRNDSRRGSSLSGKEDDRAWSPEQPSLSTSDFMPGEEISSPGQPAPVEQRAALDKLREYLTYGNRHEALEWAMSCGLWGHAMQLAGSMERRARAQVAARFLQALPQTDVLHTLYSHLQARPPPAATSVGDERWGDWRPHAAIMLSNSSAKPDQDVRSLTILGDSLLSRGLLYSAQFCYVSAGVPLSRHPLAPLQPPSPTPHAITPPRLALLLADSKANTLAQLATNQAIFATEIYEYALSLNQDFVVNELQVYKLILATRLIDVGQYERALGYAEAAARAVTRDPRAYSPALVTQLAQLADRLKYHDPALQQDAPLGDGSQGEEGEGSGGGDSTHPSPRHQQQWLDDVTRIAHTLAAEASQQSTPQHENYYTQPDPYTQPQWSEQSQQQYVQPQPTQPTPETEEPQQTYPEYTQQDYSQYYQPQQPQPAEQQGSQPHSQQYDNYWQDNTYSYGAETSLSSPGVGGGEGVEGAGEGEGGQGVAEPPRPMITMPGTAKPTRNHYDDYDDERSNSPEQRQENDAQTAKSNGKKSDAKPKEENKGSGWLGGILTKLSLRPPNQMILPDDKNPTIVWDPDKKRWRNTDGDDDVTDQPPPPPPKLNQLSPQIQSAVAAPGAPPPAAGAPPAAPVSNIFKMQKGRHIKKSYVDVFNPSGAATRALPPAQEVLGPAPTNVPQPNYFIPQPMINQGGMYDPTQMGGDEGRI